MITSPRPEVGNGMAASCSATLNSASTSGRRKACWETGAQALMRGLEEPLLVCAERSVG